MAVLLFYYLHHAVNAILAFSNGRFPQCREGTRKLLLAQSFKNIGSQEMFACENTLYINCNRGDIPDITHS